MKRWPKLLLTIAMGNLLGLGTSCHIIGPCNPPQINCALPSAGRLVSSPGPETKVTFGGTVLLGPIPTTQPASPGPIEPSLTPSPTTTSPTPLPSASPPPRLAAISFTPEGGQEAVRVDLDSAGKFTASLAAGQYRVGIVVADPDGTERTIQEDKPVLTILAGEKLALHITLSLEPGKEQLVVNKTGSSS